MRPILVCIAFLVASGCAGQNSQLATCQAEKDQLLATIRTQRETTRALNEQVASLESRLDQAEKQLARGGTDTRVSSRPADRASRTTKSVDPLPWRAPAGRDAKQASRTASGQGTSKAASVLSQLSQREPGVRYDASSLAARIELPLEFRGGGAELSAADKSRLDELSRMLRSEGARDLPIVVAGKSREQAQAVADYLDRHGISDERLLVSVNPAIARGVNQAVSIFLAGDDSPVVAEARGQTTTR